MSYNVFDASSCTLTDDERRVEACRICMMLANVQTMTATENGFFQKIRNPSEFVSIKQLFWLRDLKEKYFDFL